MESEISLNSVVRIAIPIAPPSRKLFGSRKLFSPNAAQVIPRTARKKFLKEVVMVILRFLNPRAISKAVNVLLSEPFFLSFRMDSITIFLQNFLNSYE